jgi:SAM-dependent methyltransferase
MDDFELLVDLHRGGRRQGPGGDEATRLAITLSGLRGARDLKIADIGCGTGASTLVLARELDAAVTAVDVVAPFLADLDAAAEAAGLAERIETRVAPMEELPFDDASFDAIWSEGAIYNMGFANGVEAWRRFLKPGGILAVSELTWITGDRPAELEEHWRREYPEVATASAKLAVLERNVYGPVGYFPLPETCWLDNYYRPLQERFADFLRRHEHAAAARAVVEAEEAEIALYERFSAFVSYGYYVARKIAD